MFFRFTLPGRPPPRGLERAKSMCFWLSTRTKKDGTSTICLPTLHAEKLLEYAYYQSFPPSPQILNPKYWNGVSQKKWWRNFGWAGRWIKFSCVAILHNSSIRSWTRQSSSHVEVARSEEANLMWRCLMSTRAWWMDLAMPDLNTRVWRRLSKKFSTVRAST